jgi:hypothetical protein
MGAVDDASKRRDYEELADWKFMHPRPHCFLVQGCLSKFSLEDQEQGDSSDCERLKKLHDPLGHPVYVMPGARMPLSISSSNRYIGGD